MNILVPLTITSSMISAGTSIAEPAAGETAWVSAGTYVLGDRRIRTTTHRVYECVQAHTGRTALPEADSAYWLDIAPTQRYAPFDIYTSTAATGTTSITYVMQVGFFNAISFYGLVGATLSVTVKDAPAGTVLYTSATDLYAQATGLYELLFSPLRQISRVVLKNLPISPTAEVTIVVSGASGAAVGIGMINIGDYRPLVSNGIWGGTQYGASADPKSYSYIKYFDDGTVQIQRRGATTDLSCEVVMPASDAAAAIDLVQSVLDVPVSCVATDVEGFDYLNVFGLISGSLSAAGPTHASFNFSVKGMI